MAYQRSIDLEQDGSVLYVWLDRPQVRNALNPQLITELTQCFSGPAKDTSVRVVVLGGRGTVFCAGADLAWMRDAGGMDQSANYTDAQRLTALLAALNGCPCPVVCRVQKAALGGALGLLACCDSVICSRDTVFAFSEVRLGISPATIAPYVLARIGPSHARDLFLSGERFTAEHAFTMGLVHAIVQPEELDDVVEAKVEELLQAGPAAARATKALLHELGQSITPEMAQLTERLITDLRVSAEGQEGLAAFLEKRPAAWVE